jgi:prepilin-type N-terminal cleavage/methylation domain-containing protein
MKRSANRQGFTLAELIMAIALLAFFSVVVVQVFVLAQSVTRRAETLDRAVVCASDLADQWKLMSGDTVIEPIEQLWMDPVPGRKITIYLDENFDSCDKEQSKYEADLTIEEGEAAGVWILRIQLFEHEEQGLEPLYMLETGHFPGRREKP